MSTLAEIQEAVTRLRDEERKALSLWLNSQTTPDISPDEEQRLLQSLDEAIRNVDAGRVLLNRGGAQIGGFMGCKIIFAPQAIADLAEAVSHIANNNPEAAERVGNALVDRVSILENFPLLGSSYAKRPGIRKLISSPYIIFYRAKPEEGRVDILRYWHGARGSAPRMD